jgi:hypothetical protein
MAAARQEPIVLVLRGVCLDDIKTAEDNWVALMDGSIAPVVEGVTYDSIPAHVDDPDEWLVRTNLKCWWCGLVPHGSPLTVPLVMRSGRRFDPEGIYCDDMCAVAWIEKHVHMAQQWERTNNMRMFSEYVLGVAPRDIVIPAPPPTRMQPYGGTMTRREYENAKLRQQVQQVTS